MVASQGVECKAGKVQVFGSRCRIQARERIPDGPAVFGGNAPWVSAQGKPLKCPVPEIPDHEECNVYYY